MKTLIVPNIESSLKVPTKQAVRGMFVGLSDSGVDCVTDSKIEHVLSTSALCGFF